MPELPEVETVKNQIAPHVLGRNILDVSLLWAGIVRGQPPEEFRQRAKGQKINAIARHGKYLLLSLASGEKLVIHLKMSGSLLLGQKDAEPPKYARAVIHLDSGEKIFFRDPRKFGVLKIIKDTGEIDAKLGPEPLEEGFTVKNFTDRLAKRSAPIKAVLLDQKFLAGVGNMYADEALYASRIDPRRAANSLTKPEIKRLFNAIRETLQEGIKYGGASIVTYYHPDGSTGTAHQHFKVAHGQNKTCPVCGGLVKRIVVRGRGTYFCPKCQK